MCTTFRLGIYSQASIRWKIDQTPGGIEEKGGPHMLCTPTTGAHENILWKWEKISATQATLVVSPIQEDAVNLN
jgi:hypothetical protein